MSLRSVAVMGLSVRLVEAGSVLRAVVLRQRMAGDEHALLHQVGHGGASQDLPHGRIHSAPEVLGRAVTRAEAVGGVVYAAHGRHAALEQLYHLERVDLAQRLGQQVAAARAAHGLYYARPPQLREDLLQVLVADQLALRDGLEADGLAAPHGDLDEGSHAVLRFGGDPHALMVPLRCTQAARSVTLGRRVLPSWPYPTRFITQDGSELWDRV